LSDQPVDWLARPEPLARVLGGYGLIVIDDSMAPEFRAGSIALVHPHLPPIAGGSCVFFSHGVATLRHLRQVTNDSWHVQQWNPKKDFILKRSEWPVCHVTVGSYSRRL
jgi:phage repressor protein C with HTH and peptisase S24 domain